MSLLRGVTVEDVVPPKRTQHSSALLASVRGPAWFLGWRAVRRATDVHRSSHRGDQLPGLTYEPERPAPRAPIALVVTSVQDGSPAAKADIAAGDVIDRIDGKPIASVSAVAHAVKSDATKGVELHIRHAGKSRYKHLPARTKDPHVAENTRR